MWLSLIYKLTISANLAYGSKFTFFSLAYKTKISYLLLINLLQVRDSVHGCSVWLAIFTVSGMPVTHHCRFHCHLLRIIYVQKYRQIWQSFVKGTTCGRFCRISSNLPSSPLLACLDIIIADLAEMTDSANFWLGKVGEILPRVQQSNAMSWL